MKDKILELMKEYGFTYEDKENAINFVADLLSNKQEDIKKNEPYATNTIEKIDIAIEEVNDLLWMDEE